MFMHFYDKIYYNTSYKIHLQPIYASAIISLSAAAFHSKVNSQRPFAKYTWLLCWVCAEPSGICVRGRNMYLTPGKHISALQRDTELTTVPVSQDLRPSPWTSGPPDRANFFFFWKVRPKKFARTAYPSQEKGPPDRLSQDRRSPPPPPCLDGPPSLEASRIFNARRCELATQLPMQNRLHVAMY